MKIKNFFAIKLVLGAAIALTATAYCLYQVSKNMTLSSSSQVSSQNIFSKFFVNFMGIRNKNTLFTDENGLMSNMGHAPASGNVSPITLSNGITSNMNMKTLQGTNPATGQNNLGTNAAGISGNNSGMNAGNNSGVSAGTGNNSSNGSASGGNSASNSNNPSGNSGSGSGDNSAGNPGDNSNNNSGGNSSNPGDNSGNGSGDNSAGNPGDNSGSSGSNSGNPGDNSGNSGSNSGNPDGNSNGSSGGNSGNPGDGAGNTPGNTPGGSPECVLGCYPGCIPGCDAECTPPDCLLGNVNPATMPTGNPVPSDPQVAQNINNTDQQNAQIAALIAAKEALAAQVLQSAQATKYQTVDYDGLVPVDTTPAPSDLVDKIKSGQLIQH